MQPLAPATFAVGIERKTEMSYAAKWEAGANGSGREEEIQVRAISDVETVGWFPDYERHVWIEVTIGGQKIVKRVVVPERTAHPL